MLSRFLRSRVGKNLPEQAKLWMSANNSKAAVPVSRAVFNDLVKQSKMISSQQRGFKTSTSVSNEATNVTTNTKDEDVSIFGKFGMYPMVGLGLTAALSKEILLCDEEVLLVGIYGLWVLVVYCNLSDTFNDWMKDSKKEWDTKYHGAYDMLIETLKARVEVNEKFIKSGPLMSEYRDNYEGMMKQIAVAQTMTAKSGAYDSMLAKLTSLKAQKDDENRQFQEIFATRATEFVVDNWSNVDSKTKADVVNMAIEDIGNPQARSLEQDPVRQLYQKYVDGVTK